MLVARTVPQRQPCLGHAGRRPRALAGADRDLGTQELVGRLLVVGVAQVEVVHLVERAALPDVAAAGALRRADRAHQHEPELTVVAERDQPAQVDLGQPVARAPRVVLAAAAVHLEHLVTDAHRPPHAAQVLVVPVRLAGQEDAVDVRLVRAHHRFEPVGLDAQRDLRRLGRRGREGGLRVGQHPGVFEDRERASVRHGRRAVRIADRPLLATGAEPVGRDRRAAERERAAAAGQRDARRHLGVAFVGAHADAEPAGEPGGGVVEVDVAALVPVRLPADHVQVLVGDVEPAGGHRRCCHGFPVLVESFI